MTAAPDQPTITAVDLFCGAGGFSEGLSQAAEELGFDLREAAVNHWDKAVETHEANHPDAHQYQSKVEQLHPPEVVRRLDDSDETMPDVDLLVGGPSCTHFSRARGGKPVSEQLRMSPWAILEWLELLNVESFIIENVPEIQNWGPVDDDGQPVKDGSIFESWVNVLNKLGYAVDWTELVAADYGDPTTRQRFFIVGQQSGSVTFPEPTHSNNFDDLADWRTAAEIIDWSDLGSSIWTRDLTQKRVHSPPKDTTMKRIAEGLRVHCGDAVEPFADVLEKLGKDEIRGLRDQHVVPAEHAGAVADAVDEPFLVKMPAGGAYLSTSQILRQQDGGTTWGGVEDRPVPTIATKGAHAVATTEMRPLVMPRNGPRGGLHSNSLYRPEDEPFHTVTAKNSDGYLVTPFLSPLYSERVTQRPRTRSINRPVMTVPSSKSPAAVTSPVLRPFIDDYEGTAKSLTEPLGTVTSRDKFALCVPELWPWGLDVRYRMLQPRELKQAQGFPEGYEIAGTKTDRTEQIGNAVPVNLAKALCKHVITDENPSLASFGGGIEADDDVDVPTYEEAVADD